MVRCRRVVLAVISGFASFAAAQSGTTSSSQLTSSPATSTPSLPATPGGLSSTKTEATSGSASQTSSSISTSTSAPPNLSSTDSALSLSNSPRTVVSGPPSTSDAAPSAATTTPTPPPSTSGDVKRRDLIIILSAVLGGVVILALVACLVFCIRRRTSGRSFLRRNATPIDDDEIESWRANGFEEKKSQDRTWGHNSPDSQRSEPAAHVTAQDIPSPEPAAPRRSTTTRPPNSRSGLTDSSVPGADPFIIIPPPTRRPSSGSAKLQKSSSKRRHISSSSSAGQTRFSGEAPRSSAEGRSSTSARALTPFSPITAPIPPPDSVLKTPYTHGSESAQKEDEPRRSTSQDQRRSEDDSLHRPRSHSFDFGFQNPNPP